jgi:phosphotransferase system  glucose/maltose/N-acetylglucosamine-specific IIC component
LQVLGFAHLPIATAWLHTMFRVWHNRIGSLLAVVIATVVGVAMLNTPWETFFDFLLSHWGILKAEYVHPAISLVGRLICLFLLAAAVKNARDGESVSDLYRDWFKFGNEKQQP